MRGYVLQRGDNETGLTGTFGADKPAISTCPLIYENATVRDRIICSHAVVTAVFDGLRRQTDNMHRSTVAAAIFYLVLLYRAAKGKDRELWIQFVH